MSASKKEIHFRENAIRAVADRALRGALSNATSVFSGKRQEAFQSTPLEEWRESASQIRLKVLNDLDTYVDRFCANASKAGAQVHRAKDSAEARSIIGGILKKRGIRKVVKSKSMISEEVHLNSDLLRDGIKVVETDLGEYIIQIADEHPSHIIVPAIHKDRKQVGRLFAEKLGCEYTEDPAALTKIAKNVLRQEFLSAQAGISGANFAVADTGSVAIFTNEGNGRMCTTLPPLHIVLTSIEKMIPSMSDLPKFIRLLPRSATGQIITSYLSLITGTRKLAEATGAEELHIVLLDNGRSQIVRGEYREMLKCIRCGACLNACPVYRVVGGHSYDSTYPGPMGIVLTVMLEGMEKGHPLLDATTLCGACADVCPVKVPLPSLLRKLREERVDQGATPKAEQLAMAGFAFLAQSPRAFRMAQAAGSVFWPAARRMIKNSGAGYPVPVKKTLSRRLP